MRRLVELYWRPIYCVIRHAYSKNHDDAKDLTQEFFATVMLDRELVKRYAPERGSFRALLRTALTYFMRDVARGLARQPHGGASVIPAEAISEGALADISGFETLSPEQVFNVSWNETVIAKAILLLESRLMAEGKGAAFTVFRRYHLEDDTKVSYSDLARETDLTMDQVKHGLAYGRSAFREVVTELVRGYVDDPKALATELRALLGG